MATVMACGSGPATTGEKIGRITFTVAGGFTGWERVLTVGPDGNAHVHVVRGPAPAATERQVEAIVLQKLHVLVSDQAFADLEPAYLPTPGGADLQDYTVTAEVGGRILKTMTRDGANPPQILRDVLSILNGILASTTVPR